MFKNHYVKSYTPLIAILLSHIYLLNSYNPLVGIDVGYFSSRLLDLLLHFKTEGLFVTQWWTPSYGAGIPGFPSPVHYQYSITSYLVLFFTPWTSTVLTYLIFNSLGYVLILNYVNKQLFMGTDAAIVAAVIFTTSGFWICHSLAGHLSYHTFTLIGIVPYILNSKWSCRKKVIVLSTSFIYMIHSGAFFPIYLTLLSLLQLFFIFLILNKINVKQLIKVLLISFLVVLTISISKLLAVSMHMEIIPRLNSYSSWQSYFISMPLANFFQLFSWRYLFPIEFLLPVPADSILFWVCGSRYEFWENDVSVSPMFLPIFMVFVYQYRRKIKCIIKDKKFFCFLLVMTFWISSELSIGKGLFWNLVKDLPFIKSTHVNVRYCGSIILVVTILSAFSYFHLTRKMNILKSNLFLYVTIVISLLSMVSYYLMIKEKPAFYAYNINDENEIWSDIQNGNLMRPVNTVINTPNNDPISHFEKNATCLLPHDALYGYHGHYFLPSTKIGKSNAVDSNGYFNFHNPMTFYNPKNNFGKRDKIHISDKQNFELFINRKQPHWELPFIQKIANWVTIVSILIFLLYLIKIFFQKLKT